MITQQYTTTSADTQHDEILRALNTAIEHGFIEWDSRWELDEDDPDYLALSLLSPHRAKLRKLGVTFPTKGQYQDRLEVIPQGEKRWLVKNLTKRTEYQVERKGLRLDCSCDQFGNGFCKHRDAVDATIPESDWAQAPKYELFPVDDECATITGFPDIQHGLMRASWGAITCTCGVDDCDHIEFAAKNWPRESRPDESVDDCFTIAPTPEFTFPDGFTPSDEQQDALNALAAWWHGEEKIFRLTGAAGTGKTTVIQPFLKHLLSLSTPPKIAVGAPYNKAVKVQGKFLRRFGLHGIRTFTCAQLFGVKRKEVGGEEIFERDLDAYQHYADYKLIVIDEISTINENLWDILIDAVHEGGFFGARFILMGDAAQLPPVNEAESKAFQWPCPSATLTTVQRYDGAIARIADQVRLNLSAPTFPAITQDVDADGKGIYVSSKAAWEANVRRAFTSDAYRRDPDTCRILAYTNARVAMLNAIVRRALGYTEAWAVGERIIALSPYLVDAAIGPSLTTSDEATILSIQQGSMGAWDCYYLNLDIGITVPVPKDTAGYEAELNRLYKAKEYGKYWHLKQLFADIAYGYALTVHRSQGSTFKYSFVDVHNFKKALKKKNRLASGGFVREGQQLLYVALTRASDRVFIFE